MKVELLLSLIALPVTVGIVVTRLKVKREERGNIAMRLARLIDHQTKSQTPLTLLKERHSSYLDHIKQLLPETPGVDVLRHLLVESGLENHQSTFLTIVLGLFVAPLVISSVFEWDILVASIAGIVLASIPFIALKVKAEARRTKFCEQLPNAIDLMVAVLRSGHSISQSVKAVAQEIPEPCGTEFEAVLHRMNLGQPLSEALVYSTNRFRSYELDLMRRAVSIQAEVGGSLAELLDKTNGTLRQRLKLIRQLKTVTAQSRLSAIIVAVLPIVLAVVMNIMSPGYMQLLFDDSVGRMLLIGAVILEVAGIYVMKRMSTMKV